MWTKCSVFFKIDGPLIPFLPLVERGSSSPGHDVSHPVYHAMLIIVVVSVEDYIDAIFLE